MAKAIVDRLQSIEIDEHHPGRRAIALAVLDDSLHLPHESAAIRQGGQGVGVDEMLQLLDSGRASCLAPR